MTTSALTMAGRHLIECSAGGVTSVLGSDGVMVMCLGAVVLAVLALAAVAMGGAVRFGPLVIEGPEPKRRRRG